jgi:hypothetical protein
VDVTAGDIRTALKRHRTVVIDGGRIVALGERVEMPSGAHILNVSGKYVVPGLWDMHVHTGQHELFFPLYLAHGVTGVRDMGGDQDRPTGTLSIRFQALRQWREQIANGTMLGPRLFLAGFMVDGAPQFWPGSRVIRDAVEARQTVRSLKDEGVDFLKVYSGLSRDAYFALADEVRRQRLTFAGHIPIAIGVGEASDAGQRSIEHLGQGSMLLATSGKEAELLASIARETDVAAAMPAFWRTAAEAADTYDAAKAALLFARFVRNDTWVVPTLVSNPILFGVNRRDSEMVRYIPSSIRKDWAGMFTAQSSGPLGPRIVRHQLVLVKAMHRAGVKMLAGSDSANPHTYPGLSLHEELALLVQAGLTPLEALKTATIDPATFLERADSLGSVNVGKLADLVLLDADPLSDIRNTRRIAGVVVDGRYLPRTELRKMLASVEAAASRN